MQPAIARHRRVGAALDLILHSTHAASGCGLLDEIVSGLNTVTRGQKIVLVAQMRRHAMRVVPAPIPIELAARAFDKPKQIIDLINSDCRRRRHAVSNR
jgi:hypothetical protein